jgi:hypothetical protein
MPARREFSQKVRAEIVLRATNASGRVTCEGCGGVLKRGRRHYEIDHIHAEALAITGGMIVDKSRKLTAKDGQLLGKECCHRGPDGKTAKDVAAIAKAKRREASHLGTRTAVARPIKSPGFPPTRAPRAPKLPVPPRRDIYARPLITPIGSLDRPGQGDTDD